MDPRFIPIGRVVAPWGIRGEVKVEVLTDFPDRFSCGEILYLQGRAVTINQADIAAIRSYSNWTQSTTGMRQN